jgi:hypothetical protein
MGKLVGDNDHGQRIEDTLLKLQQRVQLANIAGLWQTGRWGGG